MASRAQPVSAGPGWVAAAAIFAVVAACLSAVAFRAVGETGSPPGPADWSALRFTVWQATLSAVFSVALAIPVARALARREFPGRRALIVLLGAPFILPVIVAVLALLTVFGRGGWVSAGLGLLGLPPLSIYGLHGVVLAHVFFNLPLATRLLLQGWQEIPPERFRLAAQLGAGPRDVHRLLERPMLRDTVPGALALVFAVCLTSFAVALTLGGGPRATTVELAIYQAVRFEFDLSKAAFLSVLQLGLGVAAVALALTFAAPTGFGGGLGRAPERWDRAGGLAKALDFLAIGLAALFLLVPLTAILTAGVTGLAYLEAPVWVAAGTSVAVALASTVLFLALAIPITLAAASSQPWTETAGLPGLVASPLVIGTGLFLILYPFIDPGRAALAVTVLANALAALPFGLRVLVPAARAEIARSGRLALSLDMAGRTYLARVLLPQLRGPLGFAAGIAAALSMGDLGVIALFADPDRATLPLAILRLMGAYRMEQAAGAALLLTVLSLALFWLLDRGGRGRAAI
ncbi:thiamine/thiamine pyrophosphate ABC transporter permease ThiP [Chachezhania antarctica]|uniref:thiamine/thiamine pyrophosphate ABC transporter permease ThiP n=1 Tax=Chachezhania antarctica TaxID=2340860 RepID=UPI000EB0F2BA|nr:thiamine/thiamine pyrophosphate ABC transporter permease ThiP [Chachezhania antarctica]|tara:strand:- start:9927 stop:11486 length:1560 start_codon:yes stop_codon:yes gene_type:complete